MEAFAIGDVIALEYPYSDGKTSEKRPALVIQETPEGEVLVCMISATPRTDIPTFPIAGLELEHSKLLRVSFVRPRAILIAKKGKCKKIGRLSKSFVSVIKEDVAEWIRSFSLGGESSAQRM